MNQESDAEQLIQALSDFGLSRTEAEVYLACLDLADEGPLSSYRAAQAMGRDPANVGKVINALARWQAVRVVQQKPRLVVPVPPAEFIDQVVGRLRRRRDRAVELLEAYRAPAPAGAVSSLSSPDQTVRQAVALLGGCRRQAVAFGSGDMLRQLGHALEDAAERAGCRVDVISPVPFGSEVVHIVAVPEERLPSDGAEHWLLLAVDDRAWLTARHGPDEGTEPCGWWGSDTPAARAVALALTALARTLAAEAEQAAAAREHAAEAAAAQAAAATAVAAAQAEAAQAVERAPAAPAPPAAAALERVTPEPAAPPLSGDDGFEEGITFVFRRRADARDGADS